MTTYINNGLPVAMWYGLTAIALVNQCRASICAQCELMLAVAAHMDQAEPISENEFEAARHAYYTAGHNIDAGCAP